MKRLHCTLHTLHSPGTPAKGTATAPVEGSKSKGAVAKTKFPKIQEDKNHRETSLLEFHGDFYNAIIFQLDTKTVFCNRPFCAEINHRMDGMIYHLHHRLQRAPRRCRGTVYRRGKCSYDTRALTGRTRFPVARGQVSQSSTPRAGT